MRRPRSARANAYLWGHVYARISAKTDREPQDIHDLMCQWFLPKPRVRKVSNWPDGQLRTIVRVVPHTSQLTSAEFQTFVDQVRLFAKSCLGVDTESPDYWRYGPPAR